jgi:polysaccharide export outer membrane protein
MSHKGETRLFTLGRPALFFGCLLLSIVTCSGDVLAAAGKTSDKGQDEDRIPEYTLGPGDTFRVRVWGYSNLEQEVFIPPNGVAMVFPVGEIKAAGLTASQLDQIISEKLRKYVKEEPEIIVIPTTYVHSQVYVLGEVGNPGLYPFRGKMTVLEAITRAGNPTSRAAIQKIRVTRPKKDNPGTSKIIIVDLDSVIHKGLAANDIQLHPGDIIHVPDVISAAQSQN